MSNRNNKIMVIPSFLKWVENSLDDQMQSPASAEVIRTGLQPQVDAPNAGKDSEKHHDEIMALDSQIQRIKEIVRRMEGQSEIVNQIKDLIDDFTSGWEEIVHGAEERQISKGLGDSHGEDDQVDYMKDNQPLPEPPRSGDAIPGGQPPIS